MSLFATKYPNNIRTISGLVNVPFQDDVVLMCNTSAGAVAIQLMDIPPNQWNTLWKLYVVDASGNALLNNITITAPVGFLINGAPSFTISSNNASLIIRVASNTNFAGQYSVVGAGAGGYTTIQDEGVPLTLRSIFNFIGASVVATDDAPNFRTNITITGGASVIPILNANFLLLVSGGLVVAGQLYLITDAGLTDGGVLVLGVINNGFNSVEGTGLFLNADYQMVGDYSGVVGFGVAKGIWYASPVPPVANGDCVVWNNKNYRNLTGVWGTAPDVDIVNWVELPKSITNGYIREVDFVRYNVVANTIIYRADRRGNEVDFYIAPDGQALLLFQWGKGNVTQNKVLSGSIMVCTNSYCVFTSNVLTNGGKLSDVTNNLEFGTILRNTITQSGQIILEATKGSVEDNYVSGGVITMVSLGGIKQIFFGAVLSKNIVTSGGQMIFQSLRGTTTSNEVTRNSTLQWIDNGGIISTCLFANNGTLSVNQVAGGGGYVGCEVSDKQSIILTALVVSLFQYKKIKTGYSNWEIDLTLADFLGGTLTIPIGSEYGGIFTCTGLDPVVVDKIINLNANHRSTFKANIGGIVNFLHTLVGVAVANNMVSDAGVLNVLVGRANGYDQIEYEVSGNLVQRTNIIINA